MQNQWENVRDFQNRVSMAVELPLTAIGAALRYP
jgi:hypothetical protein